MAQQDTQAAGSGTKQPERVLDAYTIHIFPILYIQAVKDWAALDLFDTKYRARTKKSIETGRAIWGGVCALDRVAAQHLRDAKNDGKLLMCWEGSKVSEMKRGVAA